MRRLHVSSLGSFRARRLRSGTKKLVVSRRLLVLALVAAVCATVGGFANHVAGSVPGEAAGDPVIGAAGDIACDPTSSHFNGGLGDGSSSCRQKYTSDLLVSKGLAGVIALGEPIRLWFGITVCRRRWTALRSGSRCFTGRGVSTCDSTRNRW